MTNAPPNEEKISHKKNRKKIKKKDLGRKNHRERFAKSEFIDSLQ